MRDSFIFYRSFAEALNELDAEKKAELIDVMTKYALDDIDPDCSGVVKAFFALIKPQIDANNRRFENGKKGGRPKTKTKPNENQNETETKPNVNVNENENEKENEKENVNILELRKRLNVPSRETIDERLKKFREKKGE